jgi:hypothetical protein
MKEAFNPRGPTGTTISAKKLSSRKDLNSPSNREAYVGHEAGVEKCFSKQAKTSTL